MANVYLTWFGAPAAANKTVEGIGGTVRPDIFGASRLAAAGANAPAPRIKFCCLSEHAAAFGNDLNNVDIVPIEDQLPTKDYTSLTMTEPNLSDLPATVDYILRDTFNIRMWANTRIRFGNDGVPYHKLAFMKDMWSLYTLWRLGGYHVDCGCFPGGGGNITFPDPTTFGVVAVSDGGSTHPHQKIRMGRDRVCSTISSGNQVFKELVIQERTVIGNSLLNRTVDVWCMRSPAGNESVQHALEFWLRGWFMIREATRNNTLPTTELQNQAFRELIVSSVMTAITHSRKTSACNGNNWKKHVFTGRRDQNNRMQVADLGIAKVGFQSHQL